MSQKQVALVAGGMLFAVGLYTLAVYAQLPQQLPIHWDLHGNVDDWGQKGSAVWLGLGAQALMVLLLLALPAISPRNFSVDTFRKTFDYLLLVCVALMGYLQVITLQSALHPELDFGRSLIGGLLLAMALIGNVLGRTRPNFWMGVRTPWTLASEPVWTATHRLAGQLLVGAGVLGAILVWFGAPTEIALTILLAALLIPAIYSFVLYKQVGGDTA